MLIYTLFLFLLPVALPVSIISLFAKNKLINEISLLLSFTVSILIQWYIIASIKLFINGFIYNLNKTYLFFATYILLFLIAIILLYYFYLLWVKKSKISKRIQYIGFIQVIIVSALFIWFSSQAFS